MKNLKNDTNELIYKTETDLKPQKAILCYKRGRRG